MASTPIPRGVRDGGRARRSVVRLFGVHAAIRLIPVLVLGGALAVNFKSEARRRGLTEGQSEAALVAQTAIEPLLDGQLLSQGVTAQERTGFERLVGRAVAEHNVLRLRVRDLAGHVVYSDDGSGVNGPVESEVVEAARGGPVALLTQVNQ